MFAQLYCFTLLLCFTGSHQEKNPIVILISFDGFRWDYMYKTETPTLTWLASNGVSATIINNFVTRTFPNHFSIVTGMYEERHGIINNIMYDSVYKEFFYPNTTDSKWFNTSEPIWITNEKQGGGRLSAVVNWVGCETPFHGRMANFSLPFNRSIPFKTRIDLILNQIDKKPSTNFLATYFEEPDRAGHIYGPESPQCIKAIQEVDNIAKYLVQELQKRDLFDEANIIFTSDHGMSKVYSSKFIYLDQVINPATYMFVASDVNAFIVPHTEKYKHEIYRNLTKVPNINVYYKEDIPSYWHYRNSSRITPIFIAGDPGVRIFEGIDKAKLEHGQHGYNNSFSEMHPFFVAHGPAFKQGYHSDPFSIVHIYILMCHIMGITPAPNDGNLAAVAHILCTKSSNYVLLVFLIIIALAVSLLIFYGICKNFEKPLSYQWSYNI